MNRLRPLIVRKVDALLNDLEAVGIDALDDDEIGEVLDALDAAWRWLRRDERQPSRPLAPRRRWVRRKGGGWTRKVRDARGHEHDNRGRFTGSGGGAGAAVEEAPGAGEGGWDEGAPEPRRPAKPRRLKAKVVRRLDRFRNAAVRRRVLHGLRNEAELADAISAHNLPDSEPADVVLAVVEGEMLTDRDRVKQLLADRELGLKWRKHPPPPLWDPDEHPEEMALQPRETRTRIVAHFREETARRRRVEAALAAEIHFFEVKTLITQAGGGAIHMSTPAVRRKQRWTERYGAAFHTIAFDDRRGRKHSGNRLYYRAGVGSVKLSRMEKVADFDGILAKIAGG
jgi:hypothetical protein